MNADEHPSRAPLLAPSLEMVLAGYAAGSLPRALHALVGAHLEMSSANRAFVASLEDSLAQDVAGQSPGTIRARQSRLDAIFACAAAAPRISGEDPKCLVHFLGKPVDDLTFRTILPGVRECRIATGDGTQALLFRIRAGRKLPQHAHEGSEVTLVLRGGFRDETGHYGCGDIAVAGEDLDHTPVADPDEECVCFAVLDAPLRLTGPIGRLFNRFIQR